MLRYENIIFINLTIMLGLKYAHLLFISENQRSHNSNSEIYEQGLFWYWFLRATCPDLSTHIKFKMQINFEFSHWELEMMKKKWLKVILSFESIWSRRYFDEATWFY